MVHPSGIAEVLVGEVTVTHYGLLVVLHAGAGGEAGAGPENRVGPAGGAAEGPENRVGPAGRVFLAPTAKQVDATERRISVDGDTMHYEVHMAAVGEPMTPHLEATLHRTD